MNAEDEESKDKILDEFKGERERIIKEAKSNDYDQMNAKELKKYEKMNCGQISCQN